ATSEAEAGDRTLRRNDQFDDGVDGSGTQQGVERGCLFDRARKAVEDEPAGPRVELREPSRDHLDDQVVGDEMTAVDEQLSLEALRCLLAGERAEQIAHDPLREAQWPGEA